MIINLFSVFDPCTGILSLNWFSSFIFLLFIPLNYWLISNKIIYFFNLIVNTLNFEIKNLMVHKGITLILVSLFFIILINNLPGLLPYVYTSSSQLVFSLSLSLPFWLSFIIYGWFNNPNHIFCHLLPVGTPGVLISFIVIIETISNFIRPGSLAVRLTANIIAGHLLISLLGNNTATFFLIISFMFIYLLLMLFELAVATIQSYVFITLTSLYSSEV